MEYVFIGTAFILLILLGLEHYIMSKKFKYTERQINETYGQIDELDNKISTKLDFTALTLDELMKMYAKTDQFLINHFDISLLQIDLENNNWPSKHTYDFEYPINDFYKEQNIKMPNGMVYKIVDITKTSVTIEKEG